MKILITGGCGFLGSNLAQHGIKSGYEVVIVDNFYRLGSKRNLDWLKTQGKFNFYETDIANYEEIKKVFQDEMPRGVKQNTDFLISAIHSTLLLFLLPPIFTCLYLLSC